MKAKKYTLKCSKCDKPYSAKGLCRTHYKQLLGQQGGYAKEYAKRKNDPIYKEMKRKSDKAYREKLKTLGLYTLKNKEYWAKKSADPAYMEKKRETQREHHIANKNKPDYRMRRKLWQRKHRENLRTLVLNYYSSNNPKCIKCGISDMRVLAVDHINDNGASHKRDINKSGRVGNTQVYRDIIKKGFPKEYQILCWNCNYIKEYERRKLLQT